MDIVFHHSTECGIYHTVPCHGRLANELLRYDIEPVVASAIARTGMSCMQVTVIGELNVQGLQYCKLSSYLLHAIHGGLCHDGKVFLKGLTTTWA